MQNVKYCCVVVPLTVGTSTILIIHGAIFLAILIPNIDDITEGVIFSILLSIPACGFVGVAKKQHQWLIPHLILQSLIIGILIVVMILVIIFGILGLIVSQSYTDVFRMFVLKVFKSAGGAQSASNSGSSLNNLASESPAIILGLVAVVELVLGSFTGLFCHFLIVVTSYYKKLKQGRSTVRSPQQMEMNC